MIRPKTVIHAFGTERQTLFGGFCGGVVESFAGTSSGVSSCSDGRSSPRGDVIATVGIVLKDSLLLGCISETH